MSHAASSQPRRKIVDNVRGAALIEFAMVLPFLVLLFVGGFQLMDAISAYRKVGSTARALADLTTQNTTMSDTQADEILNASRQIMVPFSPGNAVLRISQIQINSQRQAVVSWSRSLNGTALNAGDIITIPTTLATPNSYYVLSEISYLYRPNVGATLIGSIPFSQSMFMSPRNSSFIVYN